MACEEDQKANDINLKPIEDVMQDGVYNEPSGFLCGDAGMNFDSVDQLHDYQILDCPEVLPDFHYACEYDVKDRYEYRLNGQLRSSFEFKSFDGSIVDIEHREDWFVDGGLVTCVERAVFDSRGGCSGRLAFDGGYALPGGEDYEANCEMLSTFNYEITENTITLCSTSSVRDCVVLTAVEQ